MSGPQITENSILDYITRRGGVVSFANLAQDIRGFNGKYTLFAEPRYRNIILWRKMSEAAVRAMQTLFREGVLVGKQGSEVTYWYGREALRRPIANPRYNGAYKWIRWLPILICLPSHNANADGYKGVDRALLGQEI